MCNDYLAQKHHHMTRNHWNALCKEPKSRALTKEKKRLEKLHLANMKWIDANMKSIKANTIKKGLARQSRKAMKKVPRQSRKAMKKALKSMKANTMKAKFIKK